MARGGRYLPQKLPCGTSGRAVVHWEGRNTM